MHDSLVHKKRSQSLIFKAKANVFSPKQLIGYPLFSKKQLILPLSVLSLHSSALVVPWVICLHNLFQESQRQTKIVLDQKWVVLFEYEVHFVIRPKLSFQCAFFPFFRKNQKFLKKGAFKAKIIARDMVKLCYKLCHCEV